MNLGRLHQRLVVMRKTPPAKLFYLSCAIAGFSRGFHQSKYNPERKQRLLVDRLCWGALYAGLYAWGHPVVLYAMVKNIEMAIRKLCNTVLDYDDDEPHIIKILDVPHYIETTPNQTMSWVK